MKKNRKELNEYLEKALVTYVVDGKIQSEVITDCYKRFQIPFLRTQTIIKLDASTAELRDPEIFWVLDSIRSVVKGAKIDIEGFFTDIEIEQYSSMKYGENKVNFPIAIPCLQVSENQWIGTVKASTLVLWRGTGSLLRYNKEIQRRVKTVVRGDLTYETVSLNNKSVNAMVKLFQDRKFIPNVVTLNIDDSSKADFYYDEETKALVINAIDHFDLTDGYHRLVALVKVIEQNPAFDYAMELRITNFTQTIASQFIWQEEQRTVMPKRDINSYNLDDISNRITKRVNESSECNLAGSIIRGGVVDFSAFADMVSECYITGKSANEKKAAIVTVPKDLISGINAITEAYPELLTRKISVMEIRMMVYCCSRFFGQPKGGVAELYGKLAGREYSTKERQILVTGATKAKRPTKLLDEIVAEEGW